MFKFANECNTLFKLHSDISSASFQILILNLLHFNKCLILLEISVTHFHKLYTVHFLHTFSYLYICFNSLFCILYLFFLFSVIFNSVSILFLIFSKHLLSSSAFLQHLLYTLSICFYEADHTSEFFTALHYTSLHILTLLHLTASSN